jgi:small-conductance mechanosensitive channel
LVAGFAAQEIVSNMFYGLAMQMERNIRYGDYLKLPSGEIVRLKKIGLKTTKLLDLAGNPIMISNAEFAKTRITKLGEVGSQAKISVPFEIESKTDLGKLQEHVKKALVSAKEVVHGPDGISVTVSKYRQGWIEGSVNMTVQDLSVSGKASDIVTRAIKGFIGRKA